jgi:pimeloyl-ACP methyl ester carboxylesterase
MSNGGKVMHEKDGDGAVGDTMPARSGPPVAYSVTGSGDPVVLIHGLAASGRYWKPSIEPLARRFRLYAVDVPGFGGSRLNQPFSIESATQRIGARIQGPGAKLHVIPHAGHNVMWNQPKAFNDLICDFLTG